MIIIDEYAKKLKSKEELETMLTFDVTNINKVNDVYEKIDKLLEIYYYINVYDKYYNIKASISGQLNEQTNNIIALYGQYNSLYNTFIKNVFDKFSITDFDNKKYQTFINKMFEEIKHLPRDNQHYLELYNESEKLYHQNRNNKDLTINDKLNLVRRYAELKEEMTKLKGYNSFLEEKLEQIGLYESVFLNLINYSIETLKECTLPKKSYSIEAAKEIIKAAGREYLDLNIITELFESVNLSDSSYVLSSYKKEPAIFVSFNNDLEGLECLFHELGHAYHYKLASNNSLISYNPNQFISEMFAMTNQLILLNYLNDEESINLFRKDYNNFFIDAVKTLKLEYFIHNNYQTFTAEDLQNIDVNYEMHLDFIFNDYYDLNYAFGFICALILCKDINNGNLGKEQISKLLSINGNLKANDMLSIVDVDLNNIDIATIINIKNI